GRLHSVPPPLRARARVPERPEAAVLRSCASTGGTGSASGRSSPRAGALSSLSHELLQDFVGLRADDALASDDERRHAGDPVLAGEPPVPLDPGLERGLLEDFPSGGDGEPPLLYDLQHPVRPGDVPGLAERRTDKRVVDPR